MNLQSTGIFYPDKPSKPAKPTPDFPLFPHATGRWAKKIKGQMRYFGRWDDPAGALRQYEQFVANGGADTSCQDNLTPARKRRKKGGKAKKPHPDFPLTPHPTGRWCKKIKGELHYFGPIDDPQAALDKYLAEKDDLLAGRVPRVSTGEVTVADVVNAFGRAKQSRLAAGKITARTVADYYATGLRIAKAFGRNRPVNDLKPRDFNEYLAQIEKTWGPVAVGNEIVRVRSFFRWGADSLDGCLLPRFGPEFKKADKKTMRKIRAQNGERMFEPEELRKIIKEAAQPLKAMILLGINLGYGNADVGTLPLSALDLKTGWADFPRPKTGVDRRGKLWPETVKAIREWLTMRPTPRDDADANLMFITKYGASWYKQPKVEELSAEKPWPSLATPVSGEMRKHLLALKLHQPGRSFYTLRHVFETIGGESCDQVAVNHVMGHADQSMAGVYRERISDERLEKVATVVHDWLFGLPKRRK